MKLLSKKTILWSIVLLGLMTSSFRYPDRRHGHYELNIRGKKIIDDKVFLNKNIEVSEINRLIRQYVDEFNLKGVTANNKYLPYNLGHMFYVPMIYAFDTKNQNLINAFDAFFTLKNLKMVSESDVLNDLDKKVYYFVNAEYLRNKNIQNNKDLTEMFNLIKNETLNFWMQKPGKIWGAEKNSYSGAEGRINGILNKTYNGDKSYYTLITDDELFVMATAASIGITERKSFGNVDNGTKNICDVFYNVLNKLVVFNPDGTWLLQPNAWKDHPDYKGIVLSKGESVNWDASHFSRVPAFLYVLGIYYDDSSTRKLYVNKLRNGLSKLFIGKVAHYDTTTNSYTFTNYIDGNDSYFRIGYRKGFSGYKPGEFNGHVFGAWWKLLGTPEMSSMYDKISANFNFYVNNNSSVKSYSNFYKEVVALK